MRLVSYVKDDLECVGVRAGEEVAPLPGWTMLSLIRSAAVAELARSALEQAEKHSAMVRPDRLLPPLSRPGKILCVELNYPSLLEFEPDDEMPRKPRYFSKLPSAIIGPGAPIVIPRPELKVDYEVELAFVIGRTAKRVSPADANDHVLGYMVLNDAAARDVQLEQHNTLFGKGIDTFCPVGPELVLADEIVDLTSLGVRSYVNGELRQNDSVANLHFSIPEIIADITQTVSLHPGDIVSTGTPAGTGLNFDPPKFLQPGDEVTVEIDQIGRLTNPVTAGWDPS